MKIDDNFRIERDDMNVTLVRKVEKIRTSDRKGSNGWSKGDKYEVEDHFYYPNIKMALKRYLDFKVGEASKVEDILSKIEEAEENIDNLKVLRI